MPDNKITIGDFEFNVILPNDLEQHISVSDCLNNWKKLIDEQKIKELRVMRLKKINEINAKYK